MKRGKRSWADFKRFVSSIHNITEDWLTPVEYLPYIYAVLGDIDLDLGRLRMSSLRAFAQSNDRSLSRAREAEGRRLRVFCREKFLG